MSEKENKVIDDKVARGGKRSTRLSFRTTMPVESQLRLTDEAYHNLIKAQTKAELLQSNKPKDP